jgi:peptidoglycan/LPS O-acetylase OafA/YrhL
MQKPTIDVFNVLRFVAILCIIFAHMDSYTRILFFQNYDTYFAYIGLVIFFFISGFLLHYNNKIKSKRDVITSIKKRATRIYPLFWMSILTTVVLDILHLNILPSNLNISDIIVDILGLQGILPMYKIPYALWFVGVILIYYMVGYFLIYYARDLKKIAIYSVVIFVLFIVVRHEIGILHFNTLDYYFVFIAGFLISFICDSKSISSEANKSIVVTSLFFTAIPLQMFYMFFSMMSKRGINKSFIDEYGILNALATEAFRVVIILYILIFVTVIITGIIIYKISYYIPDTYISKEVFSKAAYSSYAVYLFHIPILSLLKNILDIILKEGIVIDYLMLILGIPLLFIIGHYIQKRF